MNMLLLAAVGLVVVCLFGWWRQTLTRNAGHADVIWAFGVGGCALLYLLAGEGALLPRAAAALLVTLWSVRLGLHIWRRVHGVEEEGRYRAIREHYGDRVNLFHFFFFLSQGLLAWLFALPHWVIASHPVTAMSWSLLLGVAVGIAALLGEALADHQLDRFRRNPANRGKTCRDGLWRYSRHPNYFFEWLHWFSYPLIALGAPYAGWLWLAPVLMFLFLWFVTGIPYTENQALKSRGDDYRRYQQTTSPFIPWRPKS
jgi:steroid 5-alpha reductase family enzyme